MPLRVAIVGGGPAALYAAAELARTNRPEVSVNLFDRLPTLGGLARAGVAPDHAERRGMIEVYARQARRNGRFRFFGNVEIGTHLTHTDLCRHHHAVIYATGAADSRPLAIPGADLPGCHAASAFVGWYNGHPDHADLDPDLDCDRAVVIGNGNVALDVARLLLADRDTLAASDMADHARAALARSRIREVVVLGRRGPAEAAFTHPELLALGALKDVRVDVERSALTAATWPSADYGAGLRRSTLTRYADAAPSAAPRCLALRFLRSPVAALGHDRLEAVRLVRNRLLVAADGRMTAVPTAGEERLSAGLLVHATGYRGTPLAGLPFDAGRGVIPNRGGRVQATADGPDLPGVYVVGWIKRGPRGVIGSNKACAGETVSALLADADAGRLAPPGGNEVDLERLLAARQPQVVDYAGWQAIDRHERRRGQGRQPRNKVVRLDALLAVAAGVAPSETPRCVGR